MGRKRAAPVMDPAFPKKELPAGVSCRGTGQYQARKRVDGVRVMETFKTAEDAAHWLKKVDVEKHEGSFTDASQAKKYLLRDCLESFRDTVVAKRKGARTEKSCCNVLLREPIAKVRMDRLAAADLIGLISDMLESDYRPNTVLSRISIIGRAIRHGEKKLRFRLPRGNPVTHLGKEDRPKRGTHRVRRFKGDEDSRTAQACIEHEWVYMPFIRDWALATAMRLGEIVSIDFTCDIIQKQGVKVCKVRGLSGEGSKNGEVREVPLFEDAEALLIKILAVPRSTGDTRLFPSSSNATSRRWMRICEIADIHDFHFHDLRHEAACRLAPRFTQPADLGVMLGHKDPAMLWIYYNVSDGEELYKRSVKGGMRPGETVEGTIDRRVAEGIAAAMPAQNETQETSPSSKVAA